MKLENFQIFRVAAWRMAQQIGFKHSGWRSQIEESGVKRRDLLVAVGALTGTAIARYPHQVLAQPKFPAYPFSLGVASGDPLPHSVVLWTRLAPNPLQGIVLPPLKIPVQWQVATDPKLAKVVAQGTAIADPEFAHAVHVVVNRLQPDRWYWYQFQAGGEASPIGRTRTLPLPQAAVARLAFGFVSCQHYEHGYYTAYRHLAAEDLDLVFHLGDYIYEGEARTGRPRQHIGPNPVDLDSYRRRYALYKSDPDLQAAHAAFPFICTWDDHEVENDYAGAISENFANPEVFLRQRAAAYRAYYEHLPLRPLAQPQGPNMQLYRRFSFGNLADFSVLDNRQYRDDHACARDGRGGGQVVTDCQERLAPERTMLGQAQERWLLNNLAQAQARWTVIAQQGLMAELEQMPGPGEAYWSEGWDGYAANRQRILQFIQARRPANPVVIGGDIHSFWVTDLRPDFRDPRSPVVATEFVGTSISSRGPGFERFARFLPDNPHIKFFESRLRGYGHCIVEPQRWTTHLRTVETSDRPDAPVSTLATYVVEAGQPGAQRA